MELRQLGHEVVMYGVIVGATGAPGDDYRSLHLLNAKVIESLPLDDDHPWVDGRIFALPGPYPNGTYRQQAIHFGLTIKDDPHNLDTFMETWLRKFETVLRQLYWLSVHLHVKRDFSLSCEYSWHASDNARAGLLDDPPETTTEWDRTVQFQDWTPPREA